MNKQKNVIRSPEEFIVDFLYNDDKWYTAKQLTLSGWAIYTEYMWRIDDLYINEDDRYRYAFSQGVHESYRKIETIVESILGYEELIIAQDIGNRWAQAYKEYVANWKEEDEDYEIMAFRNRQ